MSLSRRSLLKWGATAAALGVSGARLSFADDEPKSEKKIPVGLQLYSVRDDCSKDLPAVLKAVSEMGYKGVEFAGYYGRNAEELRKLLDENNLKCCGTHISVDTLLGDQLKKTVEFNKILGNKFLVVSYMGEDRMGTVEKVKETAALFNELAEKVKPEGMLVGYHAHGGDLKKLGDETVWDIFFGTTKPEVVMQLDTSNCLDGHGDPYAILKKFPGRATTIHLKEHGGKPGAPLGEGEVRWNEVFELCEKPGKTEWYIVEQESYAGKPLDSVKQCIDNLKKMGKV